MMVDPVKAKSTMAAWKEAQGETHPAERSSLQQRRFQLSQDVRLSCPTRHEETHVLLRCRKDEVLLHSQVNHDS
jgi:hypothetical protein